MKALLVGAGRMGITHMAHLNLTSDFSLQWTVVEPSLALRRGLSFFMPPALLRGVHANPDAVRGNFDVVVVCSPTPHHDAAWQSFRHRAGRFFIEKPLRVQCPEDNILCGYVLLHHPLHKMLKANIAENVASIEISLHSNTILYRNEGWRGTLAAGGGVINEFGSHLLSIVVDLIGPVADIAVVSAETVHSIDAPDRAVLRGQSCSGIPFAVSMDWSDASVRKPGFAISAVRCDGTRVAHDFYEFRDGDSRQSIAALATASEVYLRGLDFAEQARVFLTDDRYPNMLAVAVETDRLLEIVT